MQLTNQLEELRALLFTGQPRHSLPPLTHPEYVTRFEERIERDPAVEWQAMRQYAHAIIPLYHKQLQEQHRIEAYMRGEEVVMHTYDDETILKKVYEEIMELETEEEWQAWVEHWTKQLDDRQSNCHSSRC